MAQFKIKLIAPDNTERELLYDNQTSSLTWGADGFGSPVLEVNPNTFQDATVVSTTQPGRKGLIKTLKISPRISTVIMKSNVMTQYPGIISKTIWKAIGF